ncbi:GAR domain-containing protein [Mycena kentingensis (nom. inval.)]|nr:GAR domain-containing protein [Mycena kentingensis (nom. inval.)]
MATLALSASQSSLMAPPSPGSMSSASSTKSLRDEEDLTITTKLPVAPSKPEKPQDDDLRLLAISTHITELSYTISDIQTRIFEIQELRHKSQASGDTAGTTAIIDQSLMSLDERIETVSKGMKSISDSLEPISHTAPTPTQNGHDSNPNAVILRKHEALVAEWESVQDESDVLREELKEDKWLTVFRTVTDQADGMMSSLEKAVNRCQEFIWQVHKRYEDPLSYTSTSQSGDKVLNFDVFTSLLESFEAKKKVLSIIDKGVRDRVTKNGETLRRHAESAQRWKSLKERIVRTDGEMDAVRKLLQGGDTPSEAGSSVSGAASRNGHLNTPSRTGSAASTLSRSISPFRKFARKITGNTVTPLSINKNNSLRAPSSEPVQTNKGRNRISIFAGLRPSITPTPTTPDRPGHRYSADRIVQACLEQFYQGARRPQHDHQGNSAEAVAFCDRKLQRYIKHWWCLPTEFFSYLYGVFTSLVSSDLVRIDHAIFLPSSSPEFASAATKLSPAVTDAGRTFSRTNTIATANTIALAYTSHIPGPSTRLGSVASPMSDDGWDDEGRTTTFQRALSPSAHPPRPPSRSLIPIPTLHLSSASRPSSSMSQNEDQTFRSNAARAQTPEFALRARVQQLPVFPGTPSRPSARPSLPGSAGKLPPSSFRDGASSRTPSRAGSRAGAYTPTMDNLPLHEYVPGNSRDPLDAEVALVCNAIAHGLLVERVDPPLKKLPKDGEEQKAQYAFSNALSRKVITCKLTTLTRPGKSDATKKVMVRVGGGWQDLSHYILNRQAGM